MALTNCTINSVDVTETGGSNLSTDTVQLVITPDPGYFVSASNFTNNTGVIAGVLSISLADSGTPGAIGNTVLVNVDLDNSIYTMPSADTDIVIDIDGAATRIEYTLTGSYNFKEANTSLTAGADIPYSISGTPGSSVEAFSFTVTADSGYFFSEGITSTVTTGVASNYSIVSTPSLDGDSNIVSYNIVVTYTFPQANVSGDFIFFKFPTSLIVTESNFITSYSLNLNSLNKNGELRPITVFGAAGTEYTLNIIRDSDSQVIINRSYTFVTSGSNTANITFPSTVADESYTITFGGDLAPTFDTVGGQSSTVVLQQPLGNILTLTLQTSNPNITLVDTSQIISLPINEIVNQTFLLAFDISSVIDMGFIDGALTNSVFTNQSNPALSFTVTNVSRVNTGLTARINVTVNVFSTTTVDLTSLCNIDAFVVDNTDPVSSDLTQQLLEDGAVLFDLVATDAEQAVKYFINSLPARGNLYAGTDTGFTTPLIPGSLLTSSRVWYKNNNTATGNVGNTSDSFTYSGFDGVTYGNISTATMAIVDVLVMDNSNSLDFSNEDNSSYATTILIGQNY